MSEAAFHQSMYETVSAERDELDAQLSASRTIRDAYANEIVALTAQVEALTAQRDEMLALLRDADLGTPRWYRHLNAFLRGVDQ